MVKVGLILYETAYVVFQSGCTILYSHKQWTDTHVAPHPHQNSVASVWILDVLTDVWWCLTVLICSSLIRASLVAQMVNSLPAMWETRVPSWVGKIPWGMKWQPTPVFLPGEFHGQNSLVSYSPQGHKELEVTELLVYTMAHDAERLFIPCLTTKFLLWWGVCSGLLPVFKNQFVSFLMLSFKSSLYILNSNLFSDVFCKHFIPVLAFLSSLSWQHLCRGVLNFNEVNFINYFSHRLLFGVIFKKSLPYPRSSRFSPRHYILTSSVFLKQMDSKKRIKGLY